MLIILQTKYNIPVLIAACLLIAGCAAGPAVTVWKNEHAFPGNYNKIMVAAITGAADTALRSAVEDDFRKALQSKGYAAVSSYKEFGTALRDLGQEDTYRALCDKGIDAVMVLAVVDRSNDNHTGPGSSYTDPVQYYYRKIWNYKDRQQNFTATSYDSSGRYSWEMILFELSTLQPHSIIQSRIYSGRIDESIQQQFWNDIIKKLAKDRFLKKRAPIIEGPKAF